MFRKTAITATGRLRKRSRRAPALRQMVTRPPDIAQAIASAVTTVPPMASTATRSACGRNDRKSMCPAASKMNGGRKTTSTVGPNAKGGCTCQIEPAIAPKATSNTAAGNRTRSATSESDSATQSSNKCRSAGGNVRGHEPGPTHASRRSLRECVSNGIVLVRRPLRRLERGHTSPHRLSSRACRYKDRRNSHAYAISVGIVPRILGDVVERCAKTARLRNRLSRA